MEITKHLEAGAYKRTSERMGCRNGYKLRTLATAVGDLYLIALLLSYEPCMEQITLVPEMV